MTSPEVLGERLRLEHGVQRDALLADVVASEGLTPGAGDLRFPLVLESVLATACRLVGARCGELGIVDAAGALERVVSWGTPTPEGRRAVLAASSRSRVGVVTSDVDAPPDVGAGPPAAPGARAGTPRPRVAGASTSGALVVPVRWGDQAIGHLHLSGRAGGGRFRARDESVALELADVVALAVVNDRSHEQSQRRQGWLDAAAVTTRALLGGADDLQEALHSAVELVRLAEGADAVALLVDDGDGLRVDARAGSPRLPDGTLAGTRVPPEAELRPLDGPSEVDPDLLGWNADRAVLVPVRMADRLAAVLAVAWVRGTGPAGGLDAVTARQFLAQVVLARELADTQSARARLAVLEDRDRIARDLHDHVIQRLFAVGMSLQAAHAVPPAAAAVDSAIVDIDDTIRDLRRAIFHLQQRPPPGHDGRGDLDAIVTSAGQGLGFLPRLSVLGSLSRVATPVRREFLAVVREALSNVTRHAGASRVSVEVEVDDDVIAGSTLSLVVTDDGCGPGAVAARATGGIANAIARATALGGSAEVGPAPGGGTRLRWHVPLDD